MNFDFYLIIGLVNEEKYLSNKVDNQVQINRELPPFSIPVFGLSPS